MNSLYELTSRFIDLFNKEELTEEELKEQATELEDMLIHKSDNLIAYDRTQELFIQNLDTEIKRLQEMKKKAEKKQEKYREYIKDNMERLGVDKIPCGLGTIKLSRCRASVEIVDENKIPEEYKEIVSTTKVNKNAILANFKETGELLPGVNMITDKKIISIK